MPTRGRRVDPGNGLIFDHRHSRPDRGSRAAGFVFADNLTNKHAQLGINTTAFAWTIPSVERVATNQPRTIGIDIKYSF